MKRVRAKIRFEGKPRLSIFRSNQYIYAQIIDDQISKTIASTSSRSLKTKSKLMEAAKEVGLEIAKQAIKAGIQKVVFDRGRYAYHGVIKALAEGAREGGLIF